MGDVTKSRFANAGPDQQNARKGAACTRAFTLIELMIVVAIIGILAAMAIPNFMTFVVRAKQVEAKGNLKAWYTVAVANVAEHGTYACGFCNFRPEKGYLYNYHGGGAAITDGRRGSTTAQGNLLDIGQTTTGFTVGAAGNIDTDTVCDSWQIDDANRLINVQNDAGS